jgi:hypothetical protein
MNYKRNRRNLYLERESCGKTLTARKLENEKKEGKKGDVDYVIGLK